MVLKEDKSLLKQIPLMEFFKERVETALNHQNIEASPDCEFYIVNLLQEFKKSEKLFEKQGTELTEKPLALLLANAHEGNTQTKIRLFKHIGDISLYTAGFFRERLKKKSVGVPYYIRMGKSAYGGLATILGRQKSFAGLFAELSTLFPNLIEVLSEVALHREWKSNSDLLRLYEKWLNTRSAQLETLLNKEGIPTQEVNLLQKIQ